MTMTTTDFEDVEAQELLVAELKAKEQAAWLRIEREGFYSGYDNWITASDDLRLEQTRLARMRITEKIDKLGG